MQRFENRKEIEIFLKSNTNYDVNLLFRTKSFSQISSMCKKIAKAMQEYPKEIIAFYKANPNVTPYFDDRELYRMNYNELSDLRRELKIKKTKKKVVKVEEAQETFQLGIESIKALDTTQLCCSMILDNESEKDLQILTEEEIKEMYGGETPSKEFLAHRGIVSDAIDEEKEVIDSEELRYSMINELINNEITISGSVLTPPFLFSLSETELETLIKLSRNFTQYLQREKGLKK